MTVDQIPHNASSKIGRPCVRDTYNVMHGYQGEAKKGVGDPGAEIRETKQRMVRKDRLSIETE